MTGFSTRQLPAAPDVLAPDGSEVRVLVSVAAGSMAHFRLQPGQVSKAVRHRTVEEVWYVVAGEGHMWRRREDGIEEITVLTVGTALTIPVGTSFQFRAGPDDLLDIVGVTMPPWPGADEAVPVAGAWPQAKP